MTRQAFNRILLSLLLLITQQMAASHAMSHWTAAMGLGKGAATAQAHQAAETSDLSRAFALDQSCDQCLAFAQLVGPLSNTPRAFVPPDMVAIAIATAVGQPACARTICAFRSRAPPQA